MGYSRVLVLHSFASDIPPRCELIASDPRLDHIEFVHVAVVDETRDAARLADFDKLLDRGLGSADLDRRRQETLGAIISDETQPVVLERVERERPDLLLVHGGTVFTAATGRVLQMLIGVREVYPDLPFALQGRVDWLIRNSKVMEDPSMRLTARAQRDWVRQNFEETPETQTLISAIFADGR